MRLGGFVSGCMSSLRGGEVVGGETRDEQFWGMDG